MSSTFEGEEMGRETAVGDAMLRIIDAMKDEDTKIIIEDGQVSEGNKELVAISIKTYLKNFKINKNKWNPQIFNDKNLTKLVTFLNSQFKNNGKWLVNGSQFPFDIYNLKMKVAVELKSEKSSIFKKRGGYSIPNTILGNATIYPLTAKVKDIVSKTDIDSSWSHEFLNSYMDVLVVVVLRDSGDKTIIDYKIVDGSYWGFDRDDYVGCKEYFSIINSELKTFNIYLAKKYKHNKFIQKIASNAYGKQLNLRLRKLISWRSPFAK